MSHYPQMAWVPARLPTGYRYISFALPRRAVAFDYQLLFEKGPRRRPTSLITFELVRRRCPAPPAWPAMGKYRIGGQLIDWSQTSSDTYAWRCIAALHPYVLFATGEGPHPLAYVVGHAVRMN